MFPKNFLKAFFLITAKEQFSKDIIDAFLGLSESRAICPKD